MIDKVFRLGKEAAIYGLSSIIGRFLNFLLVPFYTNYLLSAEYGVVANIYAYVAFVFVAYCYGMDNAYMRFVSSREIGDKEQNFSTPFFSLVATSIIFSLLIHVSAPSIAAWIGVDPTQAHLIQYAGWILFFDTLAIIPFAYLRMENKAKTFAGLRVLNIVVTVILTIIFLVVLKMKIEAVFQANLFASAFTFLFLLRLAWPQLTFRFSKQLYSEMIRFGLPYIPAGLASIAIQVIDRPIVKALTDDATLGVYQANYRLGVLMMLVVGMFDYAWRPFFLTHAKDKDAKELFGKVFTYFVAFMLFVLVVGSVFVEDLVRIRVLGRYFIHPDYWGGLAIVPVILLAYVFTGAYVNFVVGVYLEKKTRYLPYATGAGALVNVAANFALIPQFGLMGAAIATLLSYVVMATGIYFPSQRLYHVSYEWPKIIRAGVAAAVVLVPFFLLGLEPGAALSILIKTGFCAAFVLIIYAMRVFDPADLAHTKEAVARLFTKSQ
ncbi:MAG: polysaccharide biosynthesis protein [Ignavibacteria bacterium]|nr:polysaccharide biosynthesis protein [Ignavibacteria bacterium]